MQFINIKDHKTGNTVKALNFGGPKCYKVSNRYVWAPNGGTNLTINENSIVLEPLGLVVNNPNIWTIVSHQNMGTINWRVTVKNHLTQEVKTGVYPFSFNGNVYELECQPGTWVIASCKGYKIESTWAGQQSDQAYRLKGTGEIIYQYTISCTFGPSNIGKNNSWAKFSYDIYYYNNYYINYPCYFLATSVSPGTGWMGPTPGTGEQLLENFFHAPGYIVNKEEHPEYKLVSEGSLTLNIKIFSKYYTGYGIDVDYYGRFYGHWFWAPHRSYINFTITAKVGFLTQDIKDYFLSLSADNFYDSF